MKSRSMESIWGAIVFLVLSVGTSFAQELLNNSDKPIAANAGRVITPKEVLTIEDSGEKYFFKYPHVIKIGPDGSIFLIDENQFLQFDKAGKFVRNLFKKGQGPGEMTLMQNYAIAESATVAYSNYPAKLIWFDAGGKFIKNATLTQKGQILLLQGRVGKHWVFETFEFPKHSGNPAYVDQPHQLLTWDEKTDGWVPLSTFSVQIYVVPSGGGASGFFGVANFLAVPFGDRFMVISHTSEYLIKIFDLESNTVALSFRRSYARVPPPPLKPGQKPGMILLNDKPYTAPVPKIANDISNILVRKDRIWIVTSTLDKKKGALIDVFDHEGLYQDSFYLNLPEPALDAVRSSIRSALTDDALWTIEQIEEGTFAIKKYKIED